MELGEYSLAQDQQPEQAIESFRQAQALVKHSDPLYGLAAYDTAVAIYHMGAYEQAAGVFHRLMTEKITGFPIATCALWYKHASACAGYHAQHAALGIPEPTRLDPFCAAAALAASLRSFGRPFDKKTVMAHCRVTGEGSNLQDVINAGPKLGVNVRALTATDKGLIALPKPIIAFVERDHFISVIRADKKGVSYLCSDCGPWPGGQVDLTWAQWHTMAPGIYGVVTRPGSIWDQAIESVLAGKKAPAVKVASRASLQEAVALAHAFSLLTGDVIGQYIDVNQTACASVTGTQHCPAPKGGMICCPTAGGGSGGGSGGAGGGGTGSGPGGSGGGGVGPQLQMGPAAGDPVNLATGEEEYRPDPDLTVYNPVGPSVVWQRLYNHLRPIAHSYEWYDFGYNWSQTYNVSVSDPAIRVAVTAGGTASGNLTGTDQPAGHNGPPPSWDIVNPSGTVIATESTPNGWTASEDFTVSPATGLQATNEYTITPPSGTAIGNGYEMRFFGETPSSAFFDVVSTSYTFKVDSQAGTKYVILDNGARVSFSAPTVPTSTNSTVACTPQAGAPFLVEWDYDTNSGAGHFKVTFKDRTQWVFNYPEANTLSSWLGQLVDRSGNAITFHYGAPLVATTGPVLSSITNSAGTTLLTINRNASDLDQITSVSDCYGRSVYYQSTVDGFGAYYLVSQVSQVVTTGTGSPPARYTYGYQVINNGEGDTFTFVHTITVPSPTGSGTSSATINYASNNFISSIVDANGNQQVFTPGTGNTTAVTIKNSSGTTVYSYTVTFDNNMSETSITDGAGTVVSTSTFSDPNDPYRPSSSTDGNGNTYRYSWDHYGNMTSSETGRGTTTTYTYSYTNFALGELASEQEGTKSATTYTYYEPSGLTETVTSPLPGTVGSSSTVQTSYTYDSLGNMLTETTAGNNATSTITTTYNYTNDPGNSTYGIGSYSQANAINQPLTVTDNLGNVTHYRYDVQSNRTAQIDAIGNETDYTYNIANQCLQETYPATGQQGSSHSYQVNTYLYPDGPLTAIVNYDEANIQVAKVTYSFGLEGELLSRGGSTEPVKYTYDACYRPLSVTDGNGNITSYSYNAAGYLYQVVYPGATSTTPGSADTVTFTSYDNEGNVLKRLDGRDIETDYTYDDPDSLLTKVHYPGGQISDVSYTYDSYCRRATLFDGTGTATYSYDDDDNVLSVTKSFAGGPSNQQMSYAYYPDGSRETLTSPAGSFSYDYDGAGRLTSLTNPYTETSSWTYLTNDWLKTQTLGNGAVTTYTYNALGELADLANKTGGGTLLSDFGSLAYNGTRDLTTLTANIPGHTAFGGTTAYSYDSISGIGTRHQITQETSSRDGGYTNSFAYDGGSYTASTGAGNPTTLRGVSHSFNSDNQLSNTGFSYDGDGNPTTYGGNSLSFDPEDRMTTYGSVQTDAYDGDNLRAWKQTTASTTYYLYDDQNPVCELDSSGNILAVNTFADSGLLSRYSGSASIFYVFDPQGSVAERLDSSQNVVSHDTFDTFGERASTDGNSDPFGYGAEVGYYTDAETGLVLLTHRFYDPATGRFLNRDPASYDGGVNLYAYAGNDPIGLTDPSGFAVAGLCINGRPFDANKFKTCITPKIKLILKVMTKACCNAMGKYMKSKDFWFDLGTALADCWETIEDPAAFAACIAKELAKDFATQCLEAAIKALVKQKDVCRCLVQSTDPAAPGQKCLARIKLHCKAGQ